MSQAREFNLKYVNQVNAFQSARDWNNRSDMVGVQKRQSPGSLVSLPLRPVTVLG